MIVQRFFEPAIAQASYLVGCAASGGAIVIDPNRDIEPYLQAAAREGVRITHVTETHIHADFASGARELAHATGARLLLSDEGDAAWKYAFAHEGRLIRHGDRISIGNIHVDVEHTPGHTPEHLTFLITDGAAADRPIAAATGDFIFVGDVGRPDLLEKAAKIAGTMEAGARTLWRSLRAFDRHDEWLQIWPGHGAGSACGKGISAIPYSTLGYERRFNWAYAVKTEDEFVTRVLEGQPDPPAYFATMKALNKRGADLRRTALPPLLDDERLPLLVRAGARVIDTRPVEAFAAAHLPGTLSLAAGGSFVTWAGWLLPYDDDLFLIVRDTSDHAVAELVRQLALIGLDRVAGVFGPDAVARAEAGGAVIGRTPQLAPAALAARLATHDVHVLDVRHDNEWAAGHIAGAIHVPLGHLEARLAEVPTGRPLVVHCQAGTRSAIAASLLYRLGRSGVANMAGGMEAWSAAGLPVVTGKRPAVSPRLDLDRAAARFRVLAEPARLRVLQGLRGGPQHVGALIESTGLRQANLSKHLQTLYAHGVVARSRTGRFIHYSIADPAVVALCDLMCRQVGKAPPVRRPRARRRAAVTPGRECRAADSLASRTGR